MIERGARERVETLEELWNMCEGLTEAECCCAEQRLFLACFDLVMLILIVRFYSLGFV